MLPLFYLGQWGMIQQNYTDSTSDLRALVDLAPVEKRVNVVLFIGVEDLSRRIDHVKNALGPLVLIGRAEPGLLDRTMHWLNPVNRNEPITIYRIAQ